MLFNLSNPDTPLLEQLRGVVGVALVLPDELSPRAAGIQQFVIIDANDDIIRLIQGALGILTCQIEVRTLGLLIWFQETIAPMVLALPYHQLALFKGGDYLQLHSHPWRLKLLIEDEAVSREFQRKLFAQRAILHHKNAFK
ncbi:MAG: hypothetical protein HQ474_04790 [Flammeovirgaceae bacterium]|nr:hypothetical protein [Flammeovirgaceae bacterium]|tara:strand:+ start:11524 stop:11946 length:423 start_codon:yes stop_codon:yes gene_type:complete